MQNLATKHDIQLLRQDLDLLRKDMESRMELLRRDLTIRLGAMLAAAIAVVATLVKLL